MNHIITEMSSASPTANGNPSPHPLPNDWDGVKAFKGRILTDLKSSTIHSFNFNNCFI